MEQLDKVDIAILRILQEDASLSAKEIGGRIHKAASTVQGRIQRLRETGIIKKYTVIIDPDKVDLGFMTFTNVQLKDQSKKTLSNFEAAIIKFPEVLECHHMTGGHDFVLRIVARDHKEYHDVLMEKLFDTLGVGHVETKLVMKTAKSETALPIRF